MPHHNRARLANINLLNLDPKKEYKTLGKNGLLIDSFKKEEVKELKEESKDLKEEVQELKEESKDFEILNFAKAVKENLAEKKKKVKKK